MGETAYTGPAASRLEKEYLRCAADPDYFIFGHLRTKDEHDPETPVKRFPDKIHLHTVLDQIHNSEELIWYVIKSRQLQMSWLFSAYALWHRFRSHSLCLIQSKKLEDAAKMVYDTQAGVGRISFMESQLVRDEPWMAPRDEQGRPGKMVMSYGKIAFPNNTMIEAVPQGPTHVESRVITLFINDEASLQDEWAKGQAAAAPCIEGAAKAIALSTVRYPSDFSDEVEHDESARQNLVRGVDLFRSKSGIPSLRVHYSADPLKDPATEAGRKWKDAAVKKMPGGETGYYWQIHMEINFQAVGGRPVFPWFTQFHHRLVRPQPGLDMQQGWAYSAGFDWGSNNPSCLQVKGYDLKGDVHILAEIYGPGNLLGGVPGLAKRIKANQYWPYIKNRIKADPTMWARNQQQKDGGVKTIAEMFADEGVVMQACRSNVNKEADAVALHNLLNVYWADPNSPTLTINPMCVNTIREFTGLRYKENSQATLENTNESEDLVDKNNHSWDAFKYDEVEHPNATAIVRPVIEGTVNHWRQMIDRARSASDKPGRQITKPGVWT